MKLFLKKKNFEKKVELFEKIQVENFKNQFGRFFIINWHFLYFFLIDQSFI